jgi:hypothetical protein
MGTFNAIISKYFLSFTTVTEDLLIKSISTFISTFTKITVSLINRYISYTANGILKALRSINTCNEASILEAIQAITFV